MPVSDQVLDAKGGALFKVRTVDLAGARAGDVRQACRGENDLPGTPIVLLDCGRHFAAP